VTQPVPRSAITLRLLGAVELDVPTGADGAAVLARPKLLAVLSYLAAAVPRGFHRRDTLLGLFWAEMDQERARGALRQSLYYLRQFLGDGVIVTRGDEEVGVSGDLLACDVTLFEAALDAGAGEEALSVYRGDLLEGLFVSGAPGFERWLEQRREDLRRRAAREAWALAERARGESRVAAAAHWAHRSLDLAPHDEGALRQVIELLDCVGDRAGAVREYDDFARRLREDLDLAPDPETRRLVESLRSGTRPRTPAPQLPPPEPVPGAASPAPAGRSAQPLETGWRGRRWVRLGLAVGATAIVGAAAAWLSGTVGWWGALNRGQVVVAVFENLTGDSTLDPLGRMAADWITQGLEQVPLVDVVPAPATRSDLANRGWAGSSGFRGLGRAAGAGTVVSGRYYLSGDSLGIQVQIVETRTGRLLSALGPVVRARDAASALVDSVRQLVTGAVAAMFDARLSRPSAGRVPSFEAYQAYVTAYLAFYGPPSPTQWSDVLLFLNQAIALDSAFLDPRILAGFTQLSAGDRAAADSVARALVPLRPRMTPNQSGLLDYLLALVRGDREAALAAIRGVGGLGSHLCVGIEALNANHLREALKGLREAQRLMPTYRQWLALMDAHHLLGQYRRELREALAARGAFPDQYAIVEARLRAEAALGRLRDVANGMDNDLPPLASGSAAGFLRLNVAAELRAHGHRAASFEIVDRVIDWYLSHSSSNVRGDTSPEATEDRWTLGYALYRRERWDEAEAYFRDLASTLPGDMDLTGALGVVSARRGDSAAARRFSDSLSALTDRGDAGRALYWQARIGSLLGERERAVSLLREAYTRGRYVWMPVHRDMDFEPLRDYPPFRQFLRSRD